MATKATGKSTDQIIKIVSAGSNVMFDASGKSTDQLLKIATAAVRAGVTVTFLNVGGKSTDQLTRIAATGKDHVVLEV
jgi:DNA replication protein